eukprot:TRINITY_DN4360_c0_g1_i4.p1 TRINITY_DN4360_c0_g1~~TRINITY_DN4360_c0_g1_i4.p1  ORF type:complete len:126 (-),score=44.01 TRINITY_DN4360_c0_g1_i4:417-794(-)
MGITTGATIGCVLKGQHNPTFKKHLTEIGYAKAMQNAAVFDNASTSLANGSLMRCTPLGIFGFKLKDEEIYHLAKQDGSLSHSNSSLAVAVAAYSIAIADLLNGGTNITSQLGFNFNVTFKLNSS